MTLDDKVLDLLEANGEMSISQIREAMPDVSRHTLYDCMQRLKLRGYVRHTRYEHISGVKNSFWEAIETQCDFTPNRPYNGPSYTYFLQGIWNEPRVQTISG